MNKVLGCGTAASLVVAPALLASALVPGSSARGLQGNARRQPDRPTESRRAGWQDPVRRDWPCSAFDGGFAGRGRSRDGCRFAPGLKQRSDHSPALFWRAKDLELAR